MIIEPSYAEQNIIEAEKYADSLGVLSIDVRIKIIDAFIKGRISSSGDLEDLVPKYNRMINIISDLKKKLASLEGLGL